MYKIGSFANDIESTMEKELIANQIEKIHGFNKLAKAVEYLNSAATIFEEANLPDVSDQITEILKSLTKNND